MSSDDYEEEERKKREFTEHRERLKQLEPIDLRRAAEGKGPEGPKPKGLRQRYEAFKEEQSYKAFRKQKEKEERKKGAKDIGQIRVFKRKLSPTEEMEFEQFKEERKEMFKERRRKFKEGVRKFGVQAQTFNKNLNRNLAESSQGTDNVLDDSPTMQGSIYSSEGVPVRVPRRDPIAEMFSLNFPTNLGKSSSAPQGRDPLAELFSLGGVNVREDAVIRSPSGRDSLADFFSMDWSLGQKPKKKRSR